MKATALFAEPDGVRPIHAAETHWLLLNKHYAKRIPNIRYAFGVWEGGLLLGVCTYGTPAASPVRTGMLGPEMASRVLELNRLCLAENRKNLASHLVGKSLKQLPAPSAIISYADTAQGHVGTVYQAANFMYCGLSAKRTNWTLRGQEGLHGQSVADKMRGVPNRAQAMRDRYGEDFYLTPRSRKHRYVYFVGTKKHRKEMLSALRYPVQDYPRSASFDSPREGE